MLLQLRAAAVVCMLAVPATALAVQNDQPAPAAKAKQTKTAKPKKDPASQKPKKAKKPKTDVPSPDDPVDPDAADSGGGGLQFSWKQHPSLRYKSTFRLDFVAKFQEDGHWSYPKAQGLNCPNQVPPSQCVWQLHRNRIGVQGKVFKYVEYEAERELTEQELTDKDILLGYTPKSQWKDVNVNLTYFKNWQIQVGKFKVPFGLDALTGVSHNDFVYRSQGANYLAPARDIGGMVHGSFFKKGLKYSTGVFLHDGDNAKSKKIQGGGRTFAARVSGAPFRSRTGEGSLEFGTAYTFSALANDSYLANGLRGRTILSQDTFYESVYVQGYRRRWEGDVDWVLGPVSARAEYTWLSDDRNGQGLGDENLSDARAQSWYVSGTWVLTGEAKRRPLKAANDFLQGGFGAVELAGRYERMWFNSAGGSEGAYRSPRSEIILPAGERALTLGVNWTLNRFVKLQFNGIREQVENVDRDPVSNGAAFWSRVFRVQFVL